MKLNYLIVLVLLHSVTDWITCTDHSELAEDKSTQATVSKDDKLFKRETETSDDHDTPSVTSEHEDTYSDERIRLKKSPHGSMGNTSPYTGTPAVYMGPSGRRYGYSSPKGTYYKRPHKSYADDEVGSSYTGPSMAKGYSGSSQSSPHSYSDPIAHSGVGSSYAMHDSGHSSYASPPPPPPMYGQYAHPYSASMFTPSAYHHYAPPPPPPSYYAPAPYHYGSPPMMHYAPPPMAYAPPASSSCSSCGSCSCAPSPCSYAQPQPQSYMPCGANLIIGCQPTVSYAPCSAPSPCSYGGQPQIGHMSHGSSYRSSANDEGQNNEPEVGAPQKHPIVTPAHLLPGGDKKKDEKESSSNKQNNKDKTNEQVGNELKMKSSSSKSESSSNKNDKNDDDRQFQQSSFFSKDKNEQFDKFDKFDKFEDKNKKPSSHGYSGYRNSEVGQSMSGNSNTGFQGQQNSRNPNVNAGSNPNGPSSFLTGNNWGS